MIYTENTKKAINSIKEKEFGNERLAGNHSAEARCNAVLKSKSY